MRSVFLALCCSLMPLTAVAQNSGSQPTSALQSVAFSDYAEGLPMNGPSPLAFAPFSSAGVTHSTGPVRIAPSVMASRLQHRVAPVLPSTTTSVADARTSVVFVALIGKTGSVRNLKVLRGSPALVASAEQAVRQWTYQPYLLEGHPTEVLTKVVVNFDSVR